MKEHIVVDILQSLPNFREVSWQVLRKRVFESFRTSSLLWTDRIIQIARLLMKEWRWHRHQMFQVFPYIHLIPLDWVEFNRKTQSQTETCYPHITLQIHTRIVHWKGNRISMEIRRLPSSKSKEQMETSTKSKIKTWGTTGVNLQIKSRSSRKIWHLILNYWRTTTNSVSQRRTAMMKSKSHCKSPLHRKKLSLKD